MSRRGESRPVSKVQERRRQNEIPYREYWNKRFEPLGFKLCDKAYVPLNKPGERSKLVPSAPFSKILDRYFDRGVTRVDLAELAGTSPRRIQAIHVSEYAYCDFDIVDGILAAMQDSHMWHGELADVYEFAFPPYEIRKIRTG